MTIALSTLLGVGGLAVAVVSLLLSYARTASTRELLAVAKNDIEHLKDDVRAFKVAAELRARDVIGVLHQVGDERDADKLINLFLAGTATDGELRELAQIMKHLGATETPGNEGLRIAALDTYRKIEERLKQHTTVKK